MPYSIKTKDGIKINNIPDDVDPNSDVLKQRVAEIRAQKSGQTPAAPEQEQPATEEQGRLGNAVDAVADTGLEFAAGVNRGTTELLDFLGPGQINAILQLTGSEKRVPTLTDTLSAGTQGGFMEEGLPRDVARAAGEVIPSAVGAGAALRAGANQIPQMGRAGESVGRGALRDMGRSTAVQDATGAALAASGGEVGESVGGTPGRIAGTLAAPLAPAAIKGAAGAVAKPTSKAMAEAAPSVDQLKTKASELYKQIDDMGVEVAQPHVERLAGKIARVAKDQGFHPRIHPKVAAALDEVSLSGEGAMSVSDLDRLRRVVNSAAKSIEPDEARLGKLIIKEIDSFLDDVPKGALSGGDDSAGQTLKQARGLWARARKSQVIDDIIEKAKNQASGFENGLRVQFRSLLNNKKRMAGFTNEEREAVKTIVRGGPAENVARALGKFGFTEGQASSMLMGSLGVAGGAQVGGPVGAVAVPVMGQTMKKLAQTLTRKNVRLANDLVKAGPDGRRIVRAYLDNVPKDRRSTEELTGLLLNGGAKLYNLPQAKQKLVSDAAYFAEAIRNIPEEDQSGGQSGGSLPMNQ